MIYFPFAEWILRLVNWMKQKGTWFYWCWCVINGLSMAIVLKVWEETGDFPIMAFLVVIGVWICSGIVVYFYEKKHHKAA